jgi:demethylmenaquinone methyltransferase / 2-methoxy-6-polyprenyl-1,4-benzoquinol methylase
LGMDKWWRFRLVRAVQRAKPRRILDLATGSGDVAFALGESVGSATEIVGMDFCQPMLDQAIRKLASQPSTSASIIRFEQGDGLDLPLPDQSFDAVTISFGLRNMANRHRSLSEMRRVLRPGGRMFVLEFSQPHRWLKPLYLLYLRKVLPAFAGVITGDRSAYEYLNETIEQFPHRQALSEEIKLAGFSRVAVSSMTGCIVALHEAVR